jgi:hypothetical protein
VAQWSTHPPEEQTIRVRIPPGIRKPEKNSMLKLIIALIVIAIEKNIKA